jgi:hypothetical protein
MKYLLLFLLFPVGILAQSAESLFSSWATAQKEKASGFEQVSFSEFRAVSIRFNESTQRNLTVTSSGNWKTGQFRANFSAPLPNAEEQGVGILLHRANNLIPPFIWEMQVMGTLVEEQWRNIPCWKIALQPAQTSIFRHVDIWISKSDKRLVLAKGYIRERFLMRGRFADVDVNPGNPIYMPPVGGRPGRPNRPPNTNTPDRPNGGTGHQGGRPPNGGGRPHRGGGGRPRNGQFLMPFYDETQDAENSHVLAEFVRHTNGLDIPFRISLDALFPRPRRERIFHIAVQQESLLSDFRFSNP